MISRKNSFEKNFTSEDKSFNKMNKAIDAFMKVADNEPVEDVISSLNLLLIYFFINHCEGDWKEGLLSEIMSAIQRAESIPGFVERAKNT